VRLRLKPAADVLVWTPDVVAALGQRGVQIVDVRSPDEYAGKDLRAVRGGHVPGAISIPYEQNWQDPETAVKLQRKETESRAGMALKPAADLRRTYAALDPGKETFVYCQSGARASVTADVLRSLGFTRVRVYKPSWAGYAAALDAPADDEVFFDFSGVDGRISGLQNRITRLEAQVDSLRKAAAAE
jgi:thiosulfate/3-mercaptopyruvate sulfurtransferase